MPHVHVNRDLCEGHGVCASIDPTVFQVETGVLRIVEEEPGIEKLDRVHRAVLLCPRSALTLTKD